MNCIDPPTQATPARITLARTPRESDGEKTQDRYRWQTRVATQRAFELLLAYLDARNPNPDKEWVLVCEWHEDFCVLYQGSAELCAVKHRDMTSKKWNDKELITKGGLLHLFANWWYLDRVCRLSLHTNSELFSDTAKSIKKATQILRDEENTTPIKDPEHLVDDVIKRIGFIALQEHRGPGNFTLPEELISTGAGVTPSMSLRRYLKEFLQALTIITDLPARQHIDAMPDSNTVRSCLELLGLSGMLTESARDTVEALVRERMLGQGNVRCLKEEVPGYQILWDTDWRSSQEFQWAKRTLSPRQVIQALHQLDQYSPTERHRLPRTITAPTPPFIDNAPQSWGQLRWEQGPVLISGGAGLGKTSLARYYAESARHAFPHGQLMIDTRGFGPSTPMSTEEIVESLLSQIGERKRINKETIEDRCLRFLDIIEANRFMVVLDNVSDTDQILPILPRKQTSAIIVTSRRPLGTLMTQRSTSLVPLDPLPPAKAHELLSQLVGTDRLAAEAKAAEQLLSICGGIPLAITILAARLRQLPQHSLSRFVPELADADDRLDLLDLGEEHSSMRRVFSWTYQALGPELREAFVFVGSCPSPCLDVEAASALLDNRKARKLLRRLQQFNLVTERPDGRFQMHDLLRDYATSLSQDSERDRLACTGANERLIHHYASRARAAMPHPDGQPASIAWVPDNTDSLLPAVEFAASHSQVHQAATIAYALTRHLWRTGRWDECSAMIKTVLAALSSSHSPLIQAQLLRDFAVTLRRMGNHQESIIRAKQSLAILEKALPHPGEHSAAKSNYVIAVSHSYAGDQPVATSYYRLALSGFKKADDQSNVGNTLNGLGWSLSKQGEFREALACCLQATRIHQRLGEHNNEAADLDSVACISQAMGDHSTAMTYFEHCLELYRRIGHRPNEARTLDSMGESHLALGKRDRAQNSWLRAIEILEQIGHSGVDSIRKKLLPSSTEQ